MVLVDVWFVVSWLGFSDLFPSLVSFLSLVDLSLGDGSISGIWVHGIWSEVFSSSVNPVLIGGGGDISSLVVRWDFHSSSVGIILKGNDLSNSSGLLLELVKSPVGANIDNVLLFVSALGLSADPLALSVVLEGSDTGSWQLISADGNDSMFTWGILWHLEGSVWSLVSG